MRKWRRVSKTRNGNTICSLRIFRCNVCVDTADASVPGSKLAIKFFQSLHHNKTNWPRVYWSFFFSDIDECASSKGNRCQNGGTCINVIGAFQCQCPGGFIGAQCETGISAEWSIGRLLTHQKTRWDRIQLATTIFGWLTFFFWRVFHWEKTVSAWFG